MPSTAKSAVSATAGATTPTTTTSRPRVLLVDDEPNLTEVLTVAVAGLDCSVTVAGSIAAAKRLLAGNGGHNFELLVVDVGLPDGSGMALLPVLRRHCPAASAIVITGDPSVDRAVAALRDGAVDFLPKPFDHVQVTTRVRAALDQQAACVRATERTARLRRAVRKLSAARRTVSQKVDLLCNDLIGAYTDLAKQIDVVRFQETFRKHVAPAADDLEQLLCHAMDWLHRQLGPANVGLWLAGDDGVFQLGAYMKHTVAGDDEVVETMRQSILPAVTRDGLLHCPGNELPGKLTKAQRAPFAKQDVLSISATYLGEPLAVLAFFRDQSAAFTDEDVTVLRSISPVFATTLAAVVRDPSAQATADDLADADQDGDADDQRPENWWKRGDAPPF